MENNGKNIKDKVMRAIKSGEVPMRPRWHFILRFALAILGLVIIFLALLYLAGFITFSLRETGVLFGPRFGARGWVEFLRSLPWILVSLGILFIIVLELLVQHYSFAYRKPLLYSILAIIFLVLIGGNVVSLEARELWLRQTRGGHPPFPGMFYGGPGLRHPGTIHRGDVVATTTGGFIMQDILGVTSTVLFGPGPEPVFSVGDDVVVIGPRINSSTIESVDVHFTPD